VPGIHDLQRNPRKMWMAGTTLAAYSGSPGNDELGCVTSKWKMLQPPQAHFCRDICDRIATNKCQFDYAWSNVCNGGRGQVPWPGQIRWLGGGVC
jgi:hypothetical protein